MKYKYQLICLLSIASLAGCVSNSSKQDIAQDLAPESQSVRISRELTELLFQQPYFFHSNFHQGRSLSIVDRTPGSSLTVLSDEIDAYRTNDAVAQVITKSGWFELSSDIYTHEQKMDVVSDYSLYISRVAEPGKNSYWLTYALMNNHMKTIEASVSQRIEL